MLQQPSVLVTPFHRAEMANAIFQWVFRGKISTVEAQSAFGGFEWDCAAGVWQLVGLPESVFSVCVDLAKRHVSRLGVRTLDTLHVAAVLELRATRFWSFDQRQVALAEAEGLATN